MNSTPLVRQYDILTNGGCIINWTERKEQKWRVYNKLDRKKRAIWKGQEKTDRKKRAIKEIEIQIELGLTSQEQNGCV